MKNLAGYVFLDLETTGLDPASDKIIEIAALTYSETGERRILEQLLNPGVTISPFITGLTGITPEMLADAPPFGEIREELADFLEDKTLVAHNAAFDLSFLEAALGQKMDNPVIDSLELSKLLYPQMTSYALRNLARALDIKIELSHRALPDVLILEQLFGRMTETVESFSVALLQEMLFLLQGSGHPVAAFLENSLRERIRKYDFDEKIPTQNAGEEREAPQKRSGSPLWDIPALEGLLSPGGKVAQALEVYQERKQQVAMMKAVAKAFQQQRHLIVEAGTGVGKSLAYLLPAVYWAKSQEEKVVVATHTIALQEQLYRKETGFLRQNLDVPFKAAVLKGRGNYLCLNKWRRIKDNPRELNWPEKFLLARIAVWLNRDKSGDRDNINLREWENDIYQSLSSTAESCAGNLCPCQKECYYQKTKQRAQAADIVIVNHSLLLSDLKTGEMILPAYDYLIIDEAHHLDDEGTRQFSDVFSLKEFGKKLSGLMKRDIHTGGGIVYYWKKYFAASPEMLENIGKIEAIIKRLNEIINEIKMSVNSPEFPDTVRIRGEKRGERWWQVLTVMYDNLLLEGTSLLECLKVLSDSVVPDEGDTDGGLPLYTLKTLTLRIRSDCEVLKQFLQENNAGERVYWLEKDAFRMDLRLNITPLQTAGLFNEKLFSAKSSVVLTSATLSVEANFNYIKVQLGIPEELADCLQVVSPFYYEEQALLLVDSNLPDPALTGEEAYNLAVAEALELYLKTTGGNTLVLFTSHKQMRYMFDKLFEPLRQSGLELYADGVNGRRHTLISEMKNNSRAVIFGANTFWEGIDLPGEALKSLIIVRLPFAPPNLPIVEARLEQITADGGNGFAQYSLPQAVLRFKQGYGRLIRTINDSGVVIILDRRLLSKRYGKVFINSLPNQKYCAGEMSELKDKITAWQKRWG
ncbi:MAG: helicase C-terminal domain-containing protein [Clostridia bacterium]|jgi:ATP-dependent DNA helicase DinG|nr:helicase C-terminal domain-containing protein [Clostridia bacterium]